MWGGGHREGVGERGLGEGPGVGGRKPVVGTEDSSIYKMVTASFCGNN